MRVYDGILQDRPLQLPDGTSLNSVAALDAALGNSTITAAQHTAALTNAAQQAAAKVTPNPDLTRATLNQFAAARGAVPNAMTPRDVRAATSPEYLHSLAHGGGFRGDLHAMGAYGGKGALLSALFGMGGESYSMLTDDQDNPDAFERLARVGGREGLRGGLSSSLETLSATQASRYILSRGLTASSGRALAARLGSRVVPGLVDVGFEGYDIATEDRPHRPAEVSYRLGRALVIGGTSALAGAAAGAWAGAAVGTAIFPGVGTVVGFVVGVIVGAIVGFIMNEVIPNYEKMVMEQVPLKEFEKNIEAQTPASIRNQVLAEQELQLLMQVAHGPEMRGPYNMRDTLTHRNLSTSPGERMHDENVIAGSIHGGCADCHSRKGITDYDAQFAFDSDARLAPVDRMYLAALQESGNPAARPKFLDWQMPGQTVPAELAQSMGDDPTAAVIMGSINAIQPNFAAWREVAPNTEGVIPPRVMNSPLDDQALYDAIRSNINKRQWWFERFFGEAGPDEYLLYRNKLKQAEEEQKKKAK
jgi:hypothetical protein